MNIQTISDAIAAKTTELDTVLAKSEPTMEDVVTAKTLNTEIEGLQNQLTEVKSFESIKAANAARVAGNATPVNRLPQTPTVKVGETSAKANMTDAEYKAMDKSKCCQPLQTLLQASLGSCPYQLLHLLLQAIL
jgi:hypothetical protein